MRRLTLVGCCVALVGSLLWTLHGVASAQGTTPTPGKLAVIVMENEPFDDIVGSPQAPYLNQLISQGELFTDYSALASSSNPNYLAMTSGLPSPQSPPSANIFQAIDSTGSLRWKEYMESMQGNCAGGTSGDVPGTTDLLYTASHDPDYQYHANSTCTANDVPMTTGTFHSANLPDLSYIVPNECDDMHTLPTGGQACPAYFGSNSASSLIGLGDNWLAAVVPSLLAQPDMTVLITWDEGSLRTSPPEHIATLEVGAGVTAGSRDGTPYNHYSLEAGLYGHFGLGPAPNNGAAASPLPIPDPGFPPPPPPHGYWLVGQDGGIFTFGSAQFYGSTGSLRLNRPVVGITPTQDDAGYWLVASDGGLFTFGDAGFYGSIPGLGLLPAGTPGNVRRLNAPVVGMVPSSDGAGYFMVASDGGVFAFGDAQFEGSCPAIGGCSGAAVAVMPDASGLGYWVVTQTGHVYSFGDAIYYGAPGPQGTVTSAVRTPDGYGYWILFNTGAVAQFGDATNFGSLPGGVTGVLNPATAIFSTADGRGYWVATANGAVYPFGDAPNDGSMAGKHLNAPIIAAVGR